MIRNTAKTNKVFPFYQEYLNDKAIMTIDIDIADKKLMAYIIDDYNKKPKGKT